MSKPMKLSAFTNHNQHWRICAKVDDSKEFYLAGDTYVHVCDKMRPGDRITVVCEDFSWVLDLMVHGVRGSGALVFEVAYAEYPQSADEESDGVYQVKWNGRHDKFVVLVGDEKVAKNFANKDEAKEWIKQQAA